MPVSASRSRLNLFDDSDAWREATTAPSRSAARSSATRAGARPEEPDAARSLITSYFDEIIITACTRRRTSRSKV